VSVLIVVVSVLIVIDKGPRSI